MNAGGKGGPGKSARPDGETSARPSRPLGVERSVLFIDDDPMVLRAAERALRGAADRVDATASPAEALEMLSEREYAVVVSDLRMSEMDGLEMFERVRKLRPDTVCMLVSGHADLDAALSAINRVGLFRFLTKPWDRDELRSAVRQACRQFEMVQENQRLTVLLERKNTELMQVNQRLDREVQHRTTDLLLSLMNALDLRDTETQGHSRRVALYAKQLAEAIKLSAGAVLDVERGALLHDIGKIGVSDTILLKPGKLNQEEWAEMEKHALYGYQILRDIGFLGDARLVVRNHHERYDGKGYPDGLQGEQIPIGARVFAIIDTYDAMTSDRPYRKALPVEVAHEEICKNRGKQFDPKLVDVFERIPQAELDDSKQRVAESESAGLD